jgi:hypothetical protein
VLWKYSLDCREAKALRNDGDFVRLFAPHGKSPSPQPSPQKGRGKINGEGDGKILGFPPPVGEGQGEGRRQAFSFLHAEVSPLTRRCAPPSAQGAMVKN